MTYLLLSADYKLPSHRRIGTTERLRQADDVLGKSSASMFESDFPSSPLTAKSACIGDIMAVYEGALNLADDGQGLKSNKMKFSKGFCRCNFYRAHLGDLSEAEKFKKKICAMSMDISPPSAEKTTQRRLNPSDQKIFEHWRRTFSSPSTYSVAENPSQPSNTTSNSNLSSEQQHKGCITLVNKLFENSPIIIFMNSELKKVGCSPPIYCAPCPQRAHGGFHPDLGITICENHIPTRRRMESTLAHEMVHAFDHCRFKFDYSNLKHVACGEVLGH